MYIYMEIYAVASGDLSKNTTRKYIFFGRKYDSFSRSLEPCSPGTETQIYRDFQGVK